MELDRRYLPQEFSQVRSMTNEADGIDHILGKGIVFNQRSQKLGWFIEIIKPGALDMADMRDMKSFFNHNADYTLGSYPNETVSVSWDDKSADYDIGPKEPFGPIIQELVIKQIANRNITGSSFMFDIAAKGDEWEEGEGGIYIRYVTKIEKVYEMGPVSMPAYPTSTTGIAKRSFDDFINTTKRQEQEASFYRRNLAERRMKLYA